MVALAKAKAVWAKQPQLDAIRCLLCAYILRVFYIYFVLYIICFIYIPLYMNSFPVFTLFHFKFLLQSALISYSFLSPLKSRLHFLHCDLGSQDMPKSISCSCSPSPQTVTISINQSRNSLIKLSASRRRA